jgi:adhesin transport system outer membrane protein
MSRKTILALAAVAGISSAVSAAWAAPLEEELRTLIDEHPLIQSNESQVIAAEQGVKATLSPFLPSIDVTGGAGYEHVSTPSLRATPGGPLDTDAENYAATLRENVFDGGRKFANRSGAKFQLNVAELTLMNVRQSTLFEGASAYINVLRQTELVGLSGQNGDNIRRQLNLEDERVRRGSGIAVDVLQAKSRLQISLERQTASRGALEDAKSRYLQVFGRIPEDGKMALPLPLPLDKLLPRTVDEAVSIALSENPAVLAASKRIDIGEQQKKSIQAEYYPTFDIVLQDKYERDYSGLPGLRRDHTAKLQATWNLFSGFSTKSRSAQTAADTEARRSDHQQTRRKAEEQTRLAWQALQTATERVALLDNAVNIASEVFDSRKKLRESGKETVINVLDAENEVFSARINYTSALYDARIAAYQVLLAIGRLELANISSVTP